MASYRMLEQAYLKSPKFIALKPKQKALVIYVKTNCDTGGLVACNYGMITGWVGEKITKADIESIDGLFVIDDYIVDINFIKEQTKGLSLEHLNLANNAHLGIIRALNGSGLVDFGDFENEHRRIKSVNKVHKDNNENSEALYPTIVSSKLNDISDINKPKTETTPSYTKAPSKPKRKPSEDARPKFDTHEDALAWFDSQLEKHLPKYPHFNDAGVSQFKAVWLEEYDSQGRFRFETTKAFSMSSRLASFKLNNSFGSNNQPISFRQQDDNETIQAIKESQERMKAIQKMKAENIQGAISL